MSSPARPSLYQQIWQAFSNPAPRPNNNTLASGTGQYHIPGSFPGLDYGDSSVQDNDRFEPKPADDADAIRLRLADLRSREEHLSYAEAAELCDLNDAQRLQRDYEQGKLADSDVREAVRLAGLRKAFAAPQKATPTQAKHSGDEFKRDSKTSRNETKTSEPTEAELLAIRNRLSGLRARQSRLSPEEQAELCDLNDAERLQKAIEQNRLEDRDVAEASRLAHLRKAFETSQRSGKSVKQSGSQSASNHGLQASNSTAGSSANGTQPHNMPGTPMSLTDLYGRNLNQVTLRQGKNHSCYLLSAFDAIFNHPQGRQILSLIQVNRVRDGYWVKFPGQPEPIHVQKSALKGKGMPTSNQMGVTILWRAFFQTPGAPDPQDFGTTNTAMHRIFGNRVAHTWNIINTTMAESSQERSTQTAYADLWTTTRRNGYHYFSVRPNTNGSFHLVNPSNTSQLGEHFADQHAFASQFSPELTRIRLDN